MFVTIVYHAANYIWIVSAGEETRWEMNERKNEVRNLLDMKHTKTHNWLGTPCSTMPYLRNLLFIPCVLRICFFCFACYDDLNPESHSIEWNIQYQVRRWSLIHYPTKWYSYVHERAVSFLPPINTYYFLGRHSINQPSWWHIHLISMNIHQRAEREHKDYVRYTLYLSSLISRVYWLKERHLPPAIRKFVLPVFLLLYFYFHAQHNTFCAFYKSELHHWNTHIHSN